MRLFAGDPGKHGAVADMSVIRPGWVVAWLAAGSLALAGCSRQPESTPDDVVLYLKMVRIGGQPRPLSTRCRGYVDRILQADRRVRESLAELIRVRDGEYLWPADAPQWFDVDAIRAKLAALGGILDEQQPQRGAVLDDLRQAVDRIPGGILAEEDSPRIFRDAVWTALKWEFGDLRYLEGALLPMVAKHKLMYARALQRAEGLESRELGLLDDPRAREVVELFFELRLDVLAKREAAEEILARDIADAEQFVADLETEQAELEKALESRAPTAADEQRLRWIKDLIAYESLRTERCRELRSQIHKARAADAEAARRLSSSRPAAMSQPAGDERQQP